ncbi:MAG: hypothetical protein JEZ04_19015 [Spirochaetales bacterium]|nr:hypothetical protein [Spirochaetales bacterium]
MKKCSLILMSLGFLFTTLVLSCENGETIPPNLSLLFGITIDEVEYINNETYNFSLIEAEIGSKTFTLTLANTGDTDITITAVELSNSTNYSISIPELPYTAAPAGIVEASVTFSPKASGVLPATVSITLTGFTDPFVLNLTGEGNYPPTVKFGIAVTGAKNVESNGFYARNGFLQCGDTLRPQYDKTGSPNYYCYIYNASDYYFWCLDDSLDADYDTPPEYYYEYEYDNSEYMPIVPPASVWTLGTATGSLPVLTLHDITGEYGIVNEELTANYFYSDVDNDTENTAAVTYQWYSCTTIDGTYEAIAGETAKTCTPETPGVFLKVEVTPYAATGITAGKAALSSPTVEIMPPPQQNPNQ